jgi:hypothetical protein
MGTSLSGGADIAAAGSVGAVLADMVGRERVEPARVLAREPVGDLELGLHPDLARAPGVADEDLDVWPFVRAGDVVGGHV